LEPNTPYSLIFAAMNTRNIAIILMLACCSCTNNEKASQELPAESREEQLIKNIERYPDSALLKENLLQYYREAGNYDKAIGFVDGELKKDSLDPRWWDIKGTLHMEDADTLKAILAYENAIRIYPDPQYVMALGVLYAQKKDARALEMGKALLVATKAKAEKEAYFIMGLYQTNAGNKKKALELFDQCLAISYTYMPAYIEKAIILIDVQSYTEALAVLDKAVTLQNNFDQGHYYRGVCLEKLKRTQEAIEAYKLALLYDPEYIEAKNALSRLGIRD
jgi:tetratricopeptide (TPR) repeat protein